RCASAPPAPVDPQSPDDLTVPVPEAQRTDRAGRQFWIWAGANIAPINWVLGALGITMGLSLADTMIVLVLGNLVGVVVFGLFTVIGRRTGLTSMVMARGVFGRRGAYVPAVVQMVVVIGWCAVNTWIVLDLVMALFGEIGLVDPRAANLGARIGVGALIMAIQVAISFFGFRVISAFERWTVPPTLLVLFAMSVAAWGFMDIDWSYAGPATGALSGSERLVAMSQVMTAIGIGWGLTWLTYAGDYSRFVSTRVPRRRLFLISAAGQFIPVVWLGLLGASLATRGGGADPGALIVQNFGALAVPVLLLVVHGPIATNILNIYSFSVTARSLDIAIPRRALSVMVGVLSLLAVIAFVFADGIAQTLDAWLSGVVGWTATWGAVVLVHHAILDRHSTDFSPLADPASARTVAAWNPRAFLAFAAGIVMSWLFLQGMVPALQGPIATALGGLDLSWLAGGVTAGVLYCVLMRGRPLPMHSAGIAGGLRDGAAPGGAARGETARGSSDGGGADGSGASAAPAPLAPRTADEL
ncbi:cytosine permease, partial [Brachybacterium sp. ACRRE]|uniref:purine-cytosine permease family protein n=1 Tax=Brachybacterium sp. ACRRE TaxID=2918184 RepID=UPI001EF35F37